MLRAILLAAGIFFRFLWAPHLDICPSLNFFIMLHKMHHQTSCKKKNRKNVCKVTSSGLSLADLHVHILSREKALCAVRDAILSLLFYFTIFRVCLLVSLVLSF